jgi:signal transduction histidine kinase
VFAGGGEMGALMRALDWSQTPLGPVEDWPQSLRTTVSILLNSRHPMFIFWGPQLAKLYNDGYRPILGATKHPGALGQPGPDVWPEIWDTIGPMVEYVRTSGQATWSDDLLLFMHRNGYLEEVYFTFSYSPVRDETGGVAGMFCACIETTERVLGERRLRTLRDLAARASAAKTADDACRMAIDTLANNAADIPFVLLYLIDAGGQFAHLAGTVGLAPNTPASPGLVDLTLPIEAQASWPLAHVALTGQAQLVDDLLVRFGALAAGAWPEPPHSALVLPVAQSGQDRSAGVLIAGISARRALDDDYRGFFDLVAGQVATAIANAHAYEEERRRTEALAELDRAKTTFFSNVSHEFRTPLTLMLGPVEELLSEAQPDAGQREQLLIVRRNGLRLLKLVNTLLDFARIEAGRVEATYEPSDLAALTVDLASVFRSAIERAGLRLVVDCPPLPEPIYVDREMWEKIVLNLLSNALKFTFEGQITVALRQAGDHVELDVCDTGTGISVDELPNLFERFQRVLGARARTHEGSGIGLALVQELARLHGGSVRVSSVAGVGSTFTVAIPVGKDHLPAERIGAARTPTMTAIGAAPYVEEALRWLPGQSSEFAVLSSELGAQVETQNSALKRQDSVRVLLADDNADMRDYLARLLGQRWLVETVADGAAALAAARAQPPDLVLADVMMPELDGFELLRELRADPRTHTIPVILLSARADEAARVEGMEAGADAYLVKPFSSRELLAHISGHLALARSRAEIERAAGRIAHLQTVTAKLAEALTPGQVADVILAQGLVALGARAGSVAQLLSGDTVLEIIGASGYRADLIDVWRRSSVETSSPMAQAVRTASPVWLESPAERATRFPNLAPTSGDDGAWVVLPLLAKGRPIGAIGLSFAQPRLFDADDQAFMLTLAQQCAQALDRARLHVETEAAVTARDELLSIVSHDLKNPLATVKGFAQLLRRRVARIDSPETTRILDGLDKIDLATTRMSKQIAELLDATRLNAGQPLDLDHQPTNLVALVRQVVVECQQTTQSHTIQLLAPDEDLIGDYDPARLERVFANLLQNAVKYSPQGGAITVEIAREDDHGGSWATIAVSDQGIGIPADDLPQIFERFHRAGNAAGQIQGTGIGLSSARQIVEQHSGTISVASQEDVGSTFTVRLPLETTSSEF